MKSNIANLQSCIEAAKRDIERCNETIKNNKGNKSAVEGAKATKKAKQERIKAWKEQIASMRKNG